MKTKSWGPSRVLGGLLALAALAVAVPATAPLAAQERTERAECRCVDANGEEIENCTCLRTPRFENLFRRFLPWSDSRARIGVTVSADQPERDDALGARVQAVLEEGPADEAGLREDDVITSLDGRSLFDPMGGQAEEDFDLDQSIPVQRLLALARRLEPGQEVEVTYLRDGQERTTVLEAAELSDRNAWSFGFSTTPDGEALRGQMQDLQGRIRDLRIEGPGRGRVQVWTDEDAPMMGLRGGGGARVLFGPGDAPHRWECPSESHAGAGFLVFGDRCIGGLELVDLSPGLAEYFGTEDGVLVSDVHGDSQLGLEPGDVILAVGGREATDADRVRRLLGTYDSDEAVELRVMRRNQEVTVTGVLGG